MSDQFQHVMVLTSIIIGLGITNVLLGVSGAIERYTEGDRPLQLSWASAIWLAQVFLWMILFWWWEFRLVDILKHWTLWNYLPDYLLRSCSVSSRGSSHSQGLGQSRQPECILPVKASLVLFSLPAWPDHRCDGLIYEGRLDLYHRTGRVGLGIFRRWYFGGSHWISLKAHSHAYDNGNRDLCLAGSPRVRRFPVAPSLDLTNR